MKFGVSEDLHRGHVGSDATWIMSDKNIPSRLYRIIDHDITRLWGWFYYF
jgi:hypothetical protein